MRRLQTAALLVAALSIPLVGLVVALSTTAGQELLAERLDAFLNRTFAGRFTAERLVLSPAAIRVTGVAIADPAGRLVATVDELRVVPALSPGLLRGRVHLKRAELRGVRLLIDGDNLAATFAPRTPSASPGEPSSVLVTIDELQLEGARLAVGAEGPAVLLRDLALYAALKVSATGLQVDGTAAGNSLAPVRGAVRVKLRGSLTESFRVLDVPQLEAQLGGSTLRAAVTGDLAEQRFEVKDLQARLLPADATALGYTPGAPLSVSGSASLAAGVVRADVALNAAERGAATVRGTLTLAGASPSLRADVALDGLDLQALLPSLPPLRATGPLQITGSRTAGRAEAHLAPLVFGGVTFPQAAAIATWDGTGLSLSDVDVAAPGGRISGAGSLRQGQLDVGAHLTATDAAALGAATRSALAAAGVAAPDLAFAGSLVAELHVRGPAASPHLDGTLRAARLAGAGLSASGIEAVVDVAGLPAAPRGKITLAAKTLSVGEIDLEGVTADLEVRRGRAEGKVAARTRSGAVSASLGADVGPALSFVRFDRLELAWPRARFALTHPVRLDLQGGVAVDDLELRGPQGAIRASGKIGKEALALDLHASDLDVGALPPELLPADLRLQGRVDVDAKVEGSTAEPRGTAQVLWRSGSVRGVSGLGMRADVTLRERSLKGAVELVRGEAQVVARGELPWPVRDDAPLSVALVLRQLDLAEVGRAVGSDVPMAGVLGCDATVSGTLRRPEGRVAVTGRGIEAGSFSGLDVDAGVDMGGGELHLAGTAVWSGASAKADLTARIAPRELLVPRALLAAPVSGTLSVRGLALSALGLSSAGVLDADADLRGSVGGPRGTATLRVTDPAGLAGTMDLAFDDTVTRATVHATTAGVKLVDATATIEVAPEALARDLARAPLQVDATGTEVDLALLAAALGRTDVPAGKLTFTLTSSGSLAAPDARLHAVATGLALEERPLGTLQLDGAWSRGELGASVQLQGPGGGSALLDVTAAVPDAAALAAPGKTRGKLRIVAKDLDLAFASGILPDLRTLRGRLDADLSGEGVLADLPVHGTVGVEDGVVSYTGFGELRDVTADLRIDPGHLKLTRLDARSSGTLHATGEAVQASAGQPWNVSAKLDAKGFGIVSGDLLRAYLDASGQFNGTFEGGKLDARLVVSKARVSLPSTPSRDIQSLEDHPDFVIVRAGSAPQEAGPAKAPAGGGGLRATIVVEAPDIVVSGIDVNVSGEAKALKVILRPEQTEISGLAKVKSGYVIVLGRRFELTPGGWLDYRKSPIDPGLNVEASYESAYARVTVHLGGTAQSPKTTLRSSPPMSDAEIAALLATGRPTLQRGAGGNLAGGSGAASAIGAVATQQLRKGIAAKLPVDVIGIQAGEAAGTYTVEAGKYLSDRVYVGYSHQFRGLVGGDAGQSTMANENEITVEYQLTPQWTAEGTFGDAEMGSVDVFWSRQW